MTLHSLFNPTSTPSMFCSRHIFQYRVIPSAYAYILYSQVCNTNCLFSPCATFLYTWCFFFCILSCLLPCDHMPTVPHDLQMPAGKTLLIQLTCLIYWFDLKCLNTSIYFLWSLVTISVMYRNLNIFFYGSFRRHSLLFSVTGFKYTAWILMRSISFHNVKLLFFDSVLNGCGQVV